MTGLVVRRLESAELDGFGRRIAALERGITYPLGDDRFEIDHGRGGADYFAFFRRLAVTIEHGSLEPLRSYVALDGDTILGVLAAVLRRVPLRDGGTRLAWYLCDLKANRNALRHRIALPLVNAFRSDAAASANAAYAISMNDATGANRLVPYLSRFVSPAPKTPATLDLFSLSGPQIEAQSSLLESHLGSLTLIDLRGKKDIVLRSTGRPMHLLHLRYGDGANGPHSTPAFSSDAVHMFCVPRGSPLALELRARGIEPSASASVVTFGELDSTFDFVRTSDI